MTKNIEVNAESSINVFIIYKTYTTKHKMKIGFTLVELSIVLVIIGLLIGGILVGQSLIESSRIHATTQQISQFDVAVGAFDSKYRALPGDAVPFGGDGDGLITRNVTATACGGRHVNIIQNEMSQFWGQALSNIYTASNGILNYSTTANFFDIMPEAKIGNDGNYFLASAIAYSTGGYYYCADTSSPENVYAILSAGNHNGGQGLQVAAAGNRSLTAVQLLSIDTKLDDSKADTGNVRSGSIRTGNAGISHVPAAECSSGADYLVEDDDYQCTPTIRVGTVSGDAK